MSIGDIEYRMMQPAPALNDFVESCWMLVNHSEKPEEVVILPDGRVDVFFSFAATEPYHVILMGLESNAGQASLQPGTHIFAVSLKLPAIEYILDTSIASYVDSMQPLPDDFWGITPTDLDNFEDFCSKIFNTLQQLLPKKADERKLQLFDLIYASQGAISVKELSEKIFWNSRQINRYFNQRFGLSLKAYCNILRFRASFDQIKEGKLFPEQAFADQSHFIREVKKFAGVAPSALSKNKNDRFIQFSLLKRK